MSAGAGTEPVGTIRVLGSVARLRLAPGVVPNRLFLQEVVPSLEGARRWVAGGREFSFVASRMNMALMRRAYPTVEVINAGAAPPTAAAPHEEPLPHRCTYAERHPSRPYQVRAARALQAAGRRFFALRFAPGAGKTKVAIDWAGHLWCGGEISAVLVLAPSGVQSQWIAQQVPEHCGVNWRGWAWEGRVPKAERTAVEELCRPARGALSWLGMNVDAPARSKRARALAEAFVTGHRGRVLMVMDESHFIKDASSARWRAANRLGLACSHRLTLTGTPVAKDLTEDWAQWRWLDEGVLGIRYVTAFRRRYCIMGGWENREVVGHRNLRDFHARISPHSLTVRKDELGVLPKVYERWPFALHPEQQRVIAEMREELAAGIADGTVVSAANALVAVRKMYQVASGFVFDAGGVPRPVLPPGAVDPRRAALMDWVAAHPEQKLVVWAAHVPDIVGLLADLGPEQAVGYWGGMPQEERRAALAAWMAPLADRGPRVFVGNPAVGGTGLNLQGECLRAAYYSHSDNSIQRWQSEDRIHRLGTPGACVYTDFVARGSLDSRILRRLARKEDVARMALGEIAEWLAEPEED